MIINGLYIMYKYRAILDFNLIVVNCFLKGLIFLILGLFLIKNIQWSVIGAIVISLDGFFVILYWKLFFISFIILIFFLIYIFYNTIKLKMKENIQKKMKKKLDEDYIEDKISRDEYLRRKKDLEEA